jgi:membrane protein
MRPPTSTLAAIRRKLPTLAAGAALIGAFVLSRAIEHRARPTVAAALSRRGWPFWKHVLYRTYREINDDRLLALAAGVVFYGLLALFPAVTALVSSYALFADPVAIGTHLAAIASIMPASAFGIVQEQVGRLVAHGSGGLSAAFIFSLALAVWSANAGMKAIVDALNIVYGIKERRGFFRLNLVSLAFTVGAIAAMLLAIVAVAWLAGSSLLSWYLSHLADYNATYGSLGAGIGLMMWLWLTSIVVLVGAEFNSEIDAADGLLKAPQETIGPPR